MPGVLPDDLQAVALATDTLRLAVREHHPLLAKRSLRLQDLAQAEWLLPGPGAAARRSIEGRLADAGLPPPRVTVEVSSTAWGQLNPLVVHSDPITIVSESALDTPSGAGLVPLPMADARFTRTIGALTRKATVLPPLAQRFLELLEDAGRRATSQPRPA